MANTNDSGRPAAPHYDPTDDQGNSKERVKPSVSITPMMEPKLTQRPRFLKRADGLQLFTGAAGMPDGPSTSGGLIGDRPG